MKHSIDVCGYSQREFRNCVNALIKNKQSSDLIGRNWRPSNWELGNLEAEVEAVLGELVDGRDLVKKEGE